MTREMSANEPEIEVLELHVSKQWRLALYKYDKGKYSNKHEFMLLQHICSETGYAWNQSEYLKLGCRNCGPPPEELLVKLMLLSDDFDEDDFLEENMIITPKEAKEAEETKEANELNKRFMNALDKTKPTIVGLSKQTFPIHKRKDFPHWMAEDAIGIDELGKPPGGFHLPTSAGMSLAKILNQMKKITLK